LVIYKSPPVIHPRQIDIHAAQQTTTELTSNVGPKFIDATSVGPCRHTTNQLQQLWLRTSCSLTSGNRCSPTEQYTYLKSSCQNRHSLIDETDSLFKVLASFSQSCAQLSTNQARKTSLLRLLHLFWSTHLCTVSEALPQML